MFEGEVEQDTVIVRCAVQANRRRQAKNELLTVLPVVRGDSNSGRKHGQKIMTGSPVVVNGFFKASRPFE